jgi:hypothetical protein
VEKNTLVLCRVDFPQLLYPDAVRLWGAVLAQVEVVDQALGEMPVAALRKHRHLFGRGRGLFFS